MYLLQRLVLGLTCLVILATAEDPKPVGCFSRCTNFMKNIFRSKKAPELISNPTSTVSVEHLDPNQLRGSDPSMMKLITGNHGNVFDEINNYLIKMLPNDKTVRNNLNLILEWAVAEEEKPVEETDDGLLIALYSLSDLQSVAGTSLSLTTDSCGRRDLKKLKKIDQFTKGKAHVPKLGPSSSRIDYLVHTVMLNHAIKCEKVYYDRFAELYGDLDEETQGKVKMFVDSIKTQVPSVADSKKFKLPKPYKSFNELADYNLIMEILGPFSEEHAANTIHRTLDLMMDKYSSSDKCLDDPDCSSLQWPQREDPKSEREHKLALIMEYFITAPCMEYVDFFGQHIFEPFEFDNVVLKRSMVLDNKKNANERSFLEAYTRFGICRQFLQEDFEKMLERVMESVEF